MIDNPGPSDATGELPDDAAAEQQPEPRKPPRSLTIRLSRCRAKSSSGNWSN